MEVPCSGHGDCAGAGDTEGSPPSYSCDCEPGWTGYNCSRRQCVHVVERRLRAAWAVADEAAGRVRQGDLAEAGSSSSSSNAVSSRTVHSTYSGRSGCGENGFCVNGTCFCDQGWSGSDCNVRACPNSCGGRGVCRDDGTCRCADGWGGAACEQRICRGGPNGQCSGHGVCVPGFDDLHVLVSTPERRPPNATPAAVGFGDIRRVVAQPQASGMLVSVRNVSNLTRFDGTFNGTQSHTAVTVHRPAPQCVCQEGWGGPGCAIQFCPRNCSGHGACVNGTCVCGPMRQGEACDVPIAPRMIQNVLESIAFLSRRWCPNNCSRHGRCAITGVFVDADGSNPTALVNTGRIDDPAAARARGIEIIRDLPPPVDGAAESPWLDTLKAAPPVSLLQLNADESQRIRHRTAAQQGNAAGHRLRLRLRRGQAQHATAVEVEDRAAMWDWLPPMDFELAATEKQVADDEVPTTQAPVTEAARTTKPRPHSKEDSGKDELHAMSLLGLAAQLPVPGANQAADSLTGTIVQHT